MCELSSGLRACTGAPGDACRLDCTTLMRRLWRPALLVRRKGHMGMENRSCLPKVGREEVQRRWGTRRDWNWVDEQTWHTGAWVWEWYMWATGKGNYNRGQEEQAGDLLGKETNQKSESSTGRGRTNSTPHLAWNQDAWKQSFLCCQPVTWWNPSTQVSYPLQCLCQPCQRQPDGCSEPVLCQCPCRGLPVADQNTSSLLLICVGIRVVPGQDISAFSISSFKNQHKSCRETLRKLQIQVLQSLRLFA